MLKKHNQLMISLLCAADLLVLCLAWLAAYGLRMVWGWAGLTKMPMPTLYQMFPAVIVSLLLALLIFNHFGMYRVRRLKSLGAEVSGIVQAIVTVWALSYIAANFINRWQISRLLMASLLISWVLFGVAMRVAARLGLRAARRRGWNMRYAAIIGTGRLAQKLYHGLEKNAWTGIRTRFFVSPLSRDDTALRPGRMLCGAPVAGSVDDLDDLLKSGDVDIVFVALAGRRYESMEKALNTLAESAVDVRVLPDLMAFHFLAHDISQLDNMPIIGLTTSPQDGLNAILKRAFDIVCSVLALAVLALPLLIIALLVKMTSKGPVLYFQERASLGSQPFKMIKFRTMRTDAEAATGAVWTVKDDPRVTKIGRLLRATSLDELPQLFNILKGEMSLVGPRPERPELIDRFRKQIPRYMLRHSVKAGLTGWAQVNGLRGDTSLRKRVQYDLDYIMNWSFMLDIRIIFLTFFKGFVNPNAY